jgi:hypothetical protein
MFMVRAPFLMGVAGRSLARGSPRKGTCRLPGKGRKEARRGVRKWDHVLFAASISWKKVTRENITSFFPFVKT